MFNGYAINHLILSVSFAEKKKPTTRYTSGYGKALPQNQRQLLVIMKKKEYQKKQ